MTTVVKTATLMEFESLEEGVMPVGISRELRQRTNDWVEHDVVVLRLGPYAGLVGQPQQMQAFAEMLRQTPGKFKFGARLQYRAELSIRTVKHDRSLKLCFWETIGETEESRGDLFLNAGELDTLVRCIEVAATMHVPDRGPQRQVQVEIGENRFKLVRVPEGVVMFLGTERIEGSFAAAATLNSAMMKIRVALIEKATVWFGERGVTVFGVLSDSPPAVMLELHGGVQRFSFTLGQLELFTDALGSVLGDAP